LWGTVGGAAGGSALAMAGPALGCAALNRLRALVNRATSALPDFFEEESAEAGVGAGTAGAGMRAAAVVASLVLRGPGRIF
jgi:hypothetical protein